MDPFVGEIRLFPGNFAPKGWAFCNGQLLPIAQNTALFSLLGTNYGGDGRSNFGLPNLQGNAAMFWGQGPGLSLHSIGEIGGTSTVTLQNSELPSHGHTIQGTSDASQSNPSNAVGLGAVGIYGPAPAKVAMGNNVIGLTGGNQPHNNRQPYLGLNFIIALQGVFPPRP